MRDDIINELISEVLREAPPAPEELRHNVMAAISEREYIPEKRKSGILKTASALAGVVVFAVVIIVVSPLFSNGKNFSQYAVDNMDAGLGAVQMEAPAAESAAGDYSYDKMDAVGAVPPAMPENGCDKKALKSSMIAENNSYIVTGELPEELEGIDYTENADMSRVYENVPDEIIEALLKNNTNAIEAPVEGAGNVVKWAP